MSKLKNEKNGNQQFNLAVFLAKVNILKRDYSIEVTNRRSGETNSKRIANLICDCCLECSGDIHWAGILERKVYEEVKGLNFTCDITPREIEWEENKLHFRNRNGGGSFDPIKLTLIRLDKYLGCNSIILYLTHQIIKILSNDIKGKEINANGKLQRCKIGRSDKPRCIMRSIQGIQADRIELDKGQRIAICKTRKQKVCS